MTPAELLVELEARAVFVTVSGDRLKVDAPKGALSPELRVALAEHRTVLIGVIRQREAEQAVIDLFNAWEAADDPNDPRWLERWQNALAALRLPGYKPGNGVAVVFGGVTAKLVPQSPLFQYFSGSASGPDTVTAAIDELRDLALLVSEVR